MASLHLLTRPHPLAVVALIWSGLVTGVPPCTPPQVLPVLRGERLALGGWFHEPVQPFPDWYGESERVTDHGESE